MEDRSLSTDTGANVSSRKRKLLELVSKRDEERTGKTFAEGFSSLSQLHDKAND